MHKIVKFICLVCNCSFERRAKKAVTCSRECRNIKLSSERKGIAPIYKDPKERNKKVSQGLKNKPKSEEHKQKLKRPKPRKWIDNWKQSRLSKNNFKHTEEWKKEHSMQMRGSKNPSWQGGKRAGVYDYNWNKHLKQSIRKRDNYICQVCFSPEIKKAHSVHHIDYDKKNSVESNLITLCESCHVKTNFNREEWVERFKTYGT